VSAVCVPFSKLNGKIATTSSADLFYSAFFFFLSRAWRWSAWLFTKTGRTRNCPPTADPPRLVEAGPLLCSKFIRNCFVCSDCLLKIFCSGWLMVPSLFFRWCDDPFLEGLSRLLVGGSSLSFFKSSAVLVVRYLACSRASRPLRGPFFKGRDFLSVLVPLPRGGF